MEILDLITNNGESIIDYVTRLVALASIVKALVKRPSKKGVIKGLYSALDIAALNVGRAKNRPDR